jgi:hypothetical protein
MENAHRMKSFPAFEFYRNNRRLWYKMGVSSRFNLESNLIRYYKSYRYAADDNAGIPDTINLSLFVDLDHSECLNEDPRHPLTPFLENAFIGTYLQSDAEAQLLLSVAFIQPVALHALIFHGPSSNGPRTVRLFVNRVTVIGFDEAMTIEDAAQEESLDAEDLLGGVVELLRPRFRCVYNLQIFVRDNQTDEETRTRINSLTFIGLPIAVTDMREFKRVAGQPGQRH